MLYGMYTAMVTGVERAFISEIAPTNLKGTMLGLHSTVVGIALLPVSMLAGIIWNNIGSYATFTFGALLSLAATIILGLFFHTSHPTSLKNRVS